MLIFFGLTLWKRTIIKGYFGPQSLFASNPKQLKKIQQDVPDKELTVGLWASQKKIINSDYFKHHKEITILYIEDAFIRSNGLGSKFFYPYSLVFDDLGIYYNPSTPSRLEYLLNAMIKLRNNQITIPELLHYKKEELNLLPKNYDELLAQAQALVTLINTKNISKYSQGTPSSNLSLARLLAKHHGANIDLAQFDKTILVPGQVDNDASIITGGMGYNSLKLLQKVRASNPKAFIIFKIHPDVLFSSRSGETNIHRLKQYANFICTDNTPIVDFFTCCDEVHTISSLSGFDALIRGKKVFTYGLPFYANWGLTTDMNICARRNAKLKLLELVAAVLILYPKYYDWTKGNEGHSNAVSICHRLLESTKSRQNTFLYLLSYFFKFMRRLGVLK